MSTQSSGHPPTDFSITSPFQHVRLMEVPDELLGIVTDDAIRALKFKSFAPSPSRLKVSSGTAARARMRGSRDGGGSGVLHLCAPDKVWAVKQVSTSNSVYLIRPSRAAGPSTQVAEGADHDMIERELDMNGTDHGEMYRRNLNRDTVTAIAQVGNFLELHPVRIDLGAIERAIVELLPTIVPDTATDGGGDNDGDDDDDTRMAMQAANDTKPAMDMDELVDEIAFPDNVVKKVCARLGVIEQVVAGSDRLEGRRRCMVPSTRTLLAAWTSIVETCAIHGIRLDGGADINNVLDVTKILNIVGEEEQHTNADTDTVAVVNVILRDGGLFDTMGLFEDTEPHNDNNNNHKPYKTHNQHNNHRQKRLRPKETCHFVAGLILSARPRRRMKHAHFLATWTDLVPATFVKFCTLDLLLSSPASSFSVFGTTADGEMIRWTGSGSGSGSATATAAEMDSDANADADTDEATTTMTADDVVYAPALIADAVGVVGHRSSSTLSSSASTSAPASATAAAATATVSEADKKKRKWHDMFGAQRNANR